MPNFTKNCNKEKAKIWRYEQRKRYYKKTAIYKPRQWTLDEINLIFERNMTDSELSKKMHRSVASIQIMRSKIKNRK